MRFNPSFIQLFSTIEKANDFHTSADNANPSRSWLMFCPDEVYNQYILLDDALAATLEFREILKAELVDLEGNVVNNNLGFGYKKIIDKNVLLLSFKILQDYKDRCLCIRLTFNQSFSTSTEGATYSRLYSNLFTCSEYNRERTSIVTYWHLENHYEIPYKIVELSTLENSTPIRNQIRLPLYFLRWKTEQDSSENTYATNTPTNINVSRIKRREIKVWQVKGSDWINQRLAIVSDSDYVYIDSQREITRPFVYEEVDNGGGFSLSLLESQPKYGDSFIDLYGLVNHRPVILSIHFPNGSCCDPDGEPLIEPEITAESTQTDDCPFDGIHKQITITGQPNSTLKYRLTASVLQGTAKQIKVFGTDVDNTHNFTNVNQVFIGYVYIDETGELELNIRCCLEDCTPGNPISIEAKLELYQTDGVTLSGEICEIEAVKACPLPEVPVWEIVTATGTNNKTVKIIGTPNALVSVRAEILSADPPSTNRIEMNPGILNQTNVSAGSFWDVQILINPSGESDIYEIEVFTGSIFTIGTRTIYANFRLFDYDGNLTNNVVGLSHINQ